MLITTLIFFYPAFASNNNGIPILCYHNLNPVTPGSMTITPKKFESQLQWLKNNGYIIIPLKDAVEFLQGKRPTLPDKSVVITVDDGWKSVYKYMYPIVRQYNIPITLFIYPETISTGKNSMSWEELKELQQSGLFDIQGHTYSHPNFKQEKRHRNDSNYENLVNMELVNSKKILEEKMGTKISFLAWPFGIYNDFLEDQAKKAGYVMAFTIDYRKAKKSDKPMAEPRYMIIDSESLKTFSNLVGG